jgi:hypothetical protein
LANKIKVDVPEDVVKKIRYLCRLMPKEEWSGVLFYEVEGTIRNVPEMKIILKDIFLMDRGSSAYTSFTWDEDIVTFQMDNPHLLEYKIGHIHSHNVMQVFFSGTDWSELNDNCPNHNFYLSVIVNNYMDVTAKVAFTAEPPKEQIYECKDEDGKDYKLRITKESVKPIMMVYDCEITLPMLSIDVEEEFAKRAESIMNKPKPATQVAKYGSYVGQSKEDFYKDLITNAPPDYTGKKNLSKNKQPKWKKRNGQKGGKKSHLEMGELEAEMFAFEEGMYSDESDLVEEFAIFVLSLGNEVDIDYTLDDVIEDIEIAKLNAHSLAVSILESYPAYYENFFDSVDDAYYKTSQGFMNVLELVINLYEAEVEEHTFLEQVVKNLKELGHKFEEQTNFEENGGKTDTRKI